MRPFLRQTMKSSEPAFCGACGEKLPSLGAHAIACPYCGGDLHAPEREQSYGFATLDERSAHKHARNAALLSLLVPGAGQVYNGHLFKGFVILGTCWLIVPWLFGVIDAWACARRAALTPGAPQLL